MAEAANKLEPEFADAFRQWKQRPSPQTTGSLLRVAKPAIDRAIGHAAGGRNVGALRLQGRQLALRALRTYDPRQSKLETHFTHHMRGLARSQRKSTNVLGIPERVQIELGQLGEQRDALEAEEGRSLSDQEFADRSGVSLQRLGYLRRFHRPVAQGTLVTDENPEMPGTVAENPGRLWRELVYAELSPRDQFILDASLGLHEHPKLSNQAIAAKLKLSPGAISQRKAIIQAQLDNQDNETFFGG